MIKVKNTINFWRFLCGLFPIILLVPSFPSSGDDTTSGKYVFTFASHKSTCILRVNDLPAFDNTTDDDGTLSAGFNLTAFLENGDNKVELLMGPQDVQDPQTLFADSSCSVNVIHDTANGSARLASYRLTVNDSNKITAVDSVNYVAGAKATEGYTSSESDFGLYKLQGEIVLNHLPEWSWVNATPVSESDLPRIQKAYEDIWMQM